MISEKKADTTDPGVSSDPGISPDVSIIDEISRMNQHNLYDINETFEYVFVVQSYKTGKLFELIIGSLELPKINSIFVIDPTIIDDIIKEKPNSLTLTMVRGSEDHVFIDYNKNFMGRNIPLKLKIPCKQYPDGSNDEVIDLKRMVRVLQQEILVIKKINQIQQEKKVTIVPYKTLTTTVEQAHDFLNKYYCTEEYKQFILTKTKATDGMTSIKSIVDEFLNTDAKKLLFNMHYINRINGQQFVSVLDYTILNNSTV